MMHTATMFLYLQICASRPFGKSPELPAATLAVLGRAGWIAWSRPRPGAPEICGLSCAGWQGFGRLAAGPLGMLTRNELRELAAREERTV